MIDSQILRKALASDNKVIAAELGKMQLYIGYSQHHVNAGGGADPVTAIVYFHEIMKSALIIEEILEDEES